jgi:large subunit ribosomal protein L30
MASDKTLKITLYRSLIGTKQKQRQTVAALGLKRIHQTVEHSDTPDIRGMIAKVSHLVSVEEVEKSS